MKKTALFTLFLVVFLDMIGIGLVIPVLAPLFLQGNIFDPGVSYETRNALLGIVLGLYPAAQFFGAPILGALSDRYGRKPILLISLAGTLMGYLLFALAITLNHLWLLILGRVIDGFTGGNISVANSAMADMTDEKNRAKNFGVLGMAFGFGFIIGPFLGGVLSNPEISRFFDYSTPFWVAGALSIINILFVISRLPETIKEKIHAKISIFTGFKNIKKAFGMQNLRTIFLVVFLMSLGFSFFTQFFQVFLVERFHLDAAGIGYVFAFIGVSVAIVQGTLVRLVAKHFKPNQVLRVSLLGLSLIFPLLLLPEKVTYLYCVMPLIAIFNGLSYPNTTAIISTQADAASQGEVMGINQSLQALSQSLPPILAGFAVSIHYSLPILLAAGTIFLSWVVFMIFFRPQQKERFHEV